MEWTAAKIRRLREVGLCLSQDEFATALGFAKRTVGNAERGTHPPSLALRRALDRALEKASDAQRDRFLASFPADHDAPALRGTNPTLESVELLRRTAASDLGAGALEQLEELVERLGEEYFAVPPAEFREQVLSWRRYVAGLLDGRLTLRERHHPQIALYAGNPRKAVAFARAGRKVAPIGSTALVRSCTQQARASARIGDRVGTQAALDAAENAWNVLPQTRVRSIYSLGDSYLPYCSATSFVWLADQVHARTCAAWTVELVDAEPKPTVSTRVSVRADLAIALAQAHELDEAVAVAIEAMDFWTMRRAHPPRERIHELLTALQPYPEPCVIDLRERWLWISG